MLQSTGNNVEAALRQMGLHKLTDYNSAKVHATENACWLLQSTGNDVEAALRETGSINRSLFTLGQVLAGLSMRRTSSFRCA